MPYPLPDNVGGVTGLKYYLVAVPDDPAYSRAALGAYTELGNFWQWGLEGPVPGDSDLAAQQWQAAIAETIRLIQMAWPDTVIEHIDGLEALLQSILDKDPCCEGGFIGEELNDPGGIVGIDDENIPGDDVVWDVGDPPGDAADWEEATLARCAQAENFAANLYRWIGLSEALQEVGEVVSVILFVGAVAAFLPAIGLTAIAGALSIGTVYSLMQLLQTALSAGPDFTAARNELQDPDTIDAVVCAIITSDTAASAESAIDSALASHAPNAYPMLRALPLRFVMGALFNDGGTAGGFGGPCRECAVELLDFVYEDIHTIVAGGNMAATETGTHTANFTKTAASGNQGVNGLLQVLYTREDCPGTAYASNILVDFIFRINGTVDVDGSTGAIDVDFYALSDGVCRDVITGSETRTKVADLETISTPGLGVVIDYEEAFQWEVDAARQSFIAELRIGTSCQNLDLDFEIEITGISLV